jgi:hypothetical protein
MNFRAACDRDGFPVQRHGPELGVCSQDAAVGLEAWPPVFITVAEIILPCFGLFQGGAESGKPPVPQPFRIREVGSPDHGFAGVGVAGTESLGRHSPRHLGHLGGVERLVPEPEDERSIDQVGTGRDRSLTLLSWRRIGTILG